MDFLSSDLQKVQFGLDHIEILLIDFSRIFFQQSCLFLPKT